VKIHFFPGLGADDSLAPFHRLPGHDVEWIAWPKDICNDWTAFEASILRENSIDSGAVFVGISFGGMVAQRIARIKKPAVIILIGSLTGPASISPWLRAFKPVLRFFPAFLFDMGLAPRPLVARFFGIRSKAHIALLYGMAGKLTPAYFKNLNRLALGFEAQPEMEGAPVFRIHGGMDRIILAKGEPREKIIPAGGHLISMTHPEEVNAFIQEKMALITGAESA
jgi:pimeloyl-ACP methyl ester carboxylesterase